MGSIVIGGGIVGVATALALQDAAATSFCSIANRPVRNGTQATPVSSKPKRCLTPSPLFSAGC